MAPSLPVIRHVVLFENLDDTVTFHIAVVALAGEAVEIGAGRRVAGGGVPELVVLSDVGGVEDARAPFVVDVKSEACRVPTTATECGALRSHVPRQ